MIQKFGLKTINSQSKKQIEERVKRWPDGIPDVRHPEEMECLAGHNSRCEISGGGGMAAGKNSGCEISGEGGTAAGRNSRCETSG